MCVFLNSDDLVKRCRLAHSWYVKAMEDFKKTKANNEKNRKRKRKMIEIAEVTGKKRTAESSITILEPDIESYRIAAEEKIDLSFLARASSFRRTLHKKKELISELDCALEKLNDELNRDLSKQF